MPGNNKKRKKQKKNTPSATQPLQAPPGNNVPESDTLLFESHQQDTANTSRKKSSRKQVGFQSCKGVAKRTETGGLQEMNTYTESDSSLVMANSRKLHLRSSRIVAREECDLKPHSEHHQSDKGKCLSSNSSLHTKNMQEISYDAELLKSAESRNSQKMLEVLNQPNITFLQETLNKSLIEMCKQGNNFLVQKLVRLGANVETKSDNDFTPLLTAVDGRYIQIVKFLLHKGADVNAVNAAGNTALILAVHPAGSFDMTKLLLQQKGIDVHHHNHSGYTALMKAVEEQDLSAVFLLILMPFFPFFYEDMDQDFQRVALKAGLGNIMKHLSHTTEIESPLINAALAQDVDSLKILLDWHFSEIEFHVKDNLSWRTRKKKRSGITRVLEAFLEKKQCSDNPLSDDNPFSDADIPVIQLLIDNGADINVMQDTSNKNSDLPIITAIKSGSLGVVQLLYKNGVNLHVPPKSNKAHKTLVQVAAESGKLDILQFLLSLDASSGHRTHLGPYAGSAVDLCLTNGHTDCAELLLDHGNVDFNFNISEAVSTAFQRKSLPYVKFLLNKWESAVLKYLQEDKERSSRLFAEVISEDKLEFADLLISAGCDVNASYGYRGTPLEIANTPTMVQFLLDRSANIHNRNRHGSPILNRVIRNVFHRNDRLKDTVAIYLDNGADVNELDGCGRTSLMMAAQRDRDASVLKILLSHGADVNVKDRDGKTALQYVIESINLDIELGFDGKKKADVNLQDFNIDIANIDVLLACGADVNLQDKHGDNFLTLLSKSLVGLHRGSADILTKVVHLVDNIDHQNKEGYSALMLAAQNGDKESVKTLLNAGANINAISNVDDKMNVLSACVNSSFDRKHEDVMEYLLDQGADSSYLGLKGFSKVIKMNPFKLIPKIISHGLGPADRPSEKYFRSEILTDFIPTVSPFFLALLKTHTKLALYFNHMWYLTPSDLSLSAKSPFVREFLYFPELVNVLDDLCSQPMSLEKLSFVMVSAAVGCAPGREERVEKLPLPAILKEKLLFRGEDVPPFRGEDVPSHVCESPAEDDYDLKYDGDEYFDTVLWDSDGSDYWYKIR